MLSWRSFSGWGEDDDTIIFDCEGIQYVIYEWLQPIATQVTQDAQLKIVDALLMLIFRMGQ
jgi:hypothetical protein